MIAKSLAHMADFKGNSRRCNCTIMLYLIFVAGTMQLYRSSCNAWAILKESLPLSMPHTYYTGLKT